MERVIFDISEQLMTTFIKVGGADDDVLAHHLVVQFEVHLDTEALEAFEDGVAHEPGVLADAAGEEEQVAAAHLGHVAADIAFDALGEHVESIGGTLDDLEKL